MIITNAKQEDADTLTELTIRSKNHCGYGHAQIEQWRDELTITPDYIDQNSVFRLVEAGNTLGFYAFARESTEEVKLNFLFVEPEAIGKGYGKRLLTHFLNSLKGTNYKRVVLDADPHAEAFYASQGFTVIGKLKSSIAGRFLPIMQLELG